jgi:hypothetical protein
MRLRWRLGQRADSLTKGKGPMKESRDDVAITKKEVEIAKSPSAKHTNISTNHLRLSLHPILTQQLGKNA